VHAPEVHSHAFEHGWPLALSAWQVVPEQNAPPEQLVEQAPLHELLQSPEPLQVKAAHADSGSVPTGWLEQVPARPLRLHAEQPPLQSWLQQNPSTQYCEVHSHPDEQAEALALSATHDPEALQYAEALQLPLQVAPGGQFVLQPVEPLQVYTPHLFSGSRPAA
jgi:hypothetical protein